MSATHVCNDLNSIISKYAHAAISRSKVYTDSARHDCGFEIYELKRYVMVMIEKSSRKSEGIEWATGR